MASEASLEFEVNASYCRMAARRRFFGLLRRNARLKVERMTSAVATQILPIVADAGAAKELAVVSIHDVAPPTQSTAEKILTDLNRHGVRICSLLVIPNYHHCGASMQDRQFVRWLRDLESGGHEIVIHGYFHKRPRGARESLRTKFITRLYTKGEAEFYDLGYDEALQRIAAARKEFLGAGLTPRGFVAPGWLLSAEAERAARDAGLEYTTRLRSVRDLRCGETFAARSIVYSVRSESRRRVSVAWNRMIAELLKNAPLLRLSIHPGDYNYPAVWRHIVDLVGKLEGVRTATTYRDWIAERRVNANSDPSK
jgi:predicted deacetylase